MIRIFVTFLSILALSLTAFAGSPFEGEFDERSGQGCLDERAVPPSQPPGCAAFRERFEALQRLRSNENSDSEAQGNLSLIEGFSRQGVISLQDGVTLFISLQNLMGGVSATDETRTVFRLIMNSTPKFSINDTSESFRMIFKNENGLQDSINGLKMIMSSRLAQYGLIPSTTVYLKMLEFLGGVNLSTEAQSIYRKIDGVWGKDSYAKHWAVFKALFQAENGMADATANYDLVLRAAKICGSLDQAATDFLRVQRSSGGADSTTEAQKAFRLLYGF
ncbi:MAG: hypothetical protein AABY64_02670 [Bdellovibrionota bacterium]